MSLSSEQNKTHSTQNVKFILVVVITILILVLLLIILILINSNNTHQLEANDSPISSPVSMTVPFISYPLPTTETKLISQTFNTFPDKSQKLFIYIPVNVVSNIELLPKSSKGNDCFSFIIRSPFTTNYLQINNVCGDWVAVYTKLPSNSIVVDFYKDFYKYSGGGDSFLIRSTTDYGYNYGQSESNDTESKTYFNDIIVNFKHQDPEDFIVVSVKIIVKEKSKYLDNELSIFDNVVKSLYLER